MSHVWLTIGLRTWHLQALTVMHLPVDLAATNNALRLFLNYFSTARQQLKMHQLWWSATLSLTCLHWQRLKIFMLSAEQCPEVRAVHSGAQGSVCQQDLLLRSGPEHHQGKEHLHGLEH